MYVARDEDGSLYLYGFKPERQYNTWYDWDDGSHFNIIELDRELFPKLKWEDDPIEVKLITTSDMQFIAIQNELF